MVEYLEDSHTYLVDGIVVPSVTRLVGWKLNEDFSRIPPKILNAKAQYGTEVHGLIEAYENGMTLKELSFMDIDRNQKSAVNHYANLKKKAKFKVKNMEQIVYNDKLAGRYDILTTKDELIDIKTTYRLNEQYLEWQLGLYYYLIGMDKRIGYVMWLPKQTEPQFKMINCHSNKECEELIEAFLNSQ